MKKNIGFWVGPLPPKVCGVGHYAYQLGNAVNKNLVEILFLNELLPCNWKIFDFIKFINLIKKLKLSVLHLQYPCKDLKYSLLPPLIFIYLRLFTKIKIFITLHEFKHSHLSRKIMSLILSTLAHKIIVVDKTQLVFFPYPFIHIPLTGSIIPLEKSQKKIKSKITIGSWGLFRADKGIEYLINAIPLIIKNFPDKYSFVFIGELGEDEKYIKFIQECINEHKLENFIRFTHRLNEVDLSKELSELDICVLPYINGVEPNRTTFLTAIEFNIPVVTTTLEKPHYDAKNGVCYVSTKDSLQIANAIEFLVEKIIKGEMNIENTLNNKGLGGIAEHLKLWNTL